MKSQPSTITCKGLSASWASGYLAALGCAVAVPGMRLSWTDEPVPTAILTHDINPHSALAQAIPSIVSSMATSLRDCQTKMTEQGVKEKYLPARVYRQEISKHIREYIDPLSALFCDQDTYRGEDDVETCYASQIFYHGVPKGVTMSKRLTQVWQDLKEAHPNSLSQVVRQSLDGEPDLIDANGLGFEIRRVLRNNHPGSRSPKVDPVVELLSFAGISLLPLRGQGIATQKEKKRGTITTRQRCQPRSFSYQGPMLRCPTWNHDDGLDVWGIDCLLTHWEALWDKCNAGNVPKQKDLERIQVNSGWETEVIKSDENTPKVGLFAKKIDFDERRRRSSHRPNAATSETMTV